MIRIKRTGEYFDWLYFVAYGFYLVSAILSASFYYRYFSEFAKGFIVVYCVILLLHELTYTYVTKRELGGLAVCVIMFALAFLVGVGVLQNTVAATFLFIYGARNIRFEKIAVFSLIVSAVLLLFVVTSAYLGIIPNELLIQNGDRYRYCLGFRYALYGATIYFNIVMLWIYIRKQKIMLIEAIILMAINYWFYRMTDSRLLFWLAVIMVAIAFILKWFPGWLERRKAINLIAVFSYVISSVASICVSRFYDPNTSWMKQLDVYLHERLSLGQDSLQQYGVKLLGQKIEWIGNGLDMYGNVTEGTYSYVDSFYIQILQRYGIVFAVIVCVAMTVMLARCLKNREYYLLYILAAIGFHSMIDDLHLYLYYNTFWLAIGGILFSYTGNAIRTKRSTTVPGEVRWEKSKNP